MRRTRTHIVLGMALLLSSLLFVSSGWGAEGDTFSFISRKNGTTDLYFMDIRGELLRQITFKTPSMYGHTWSPDSSSFAYVSNKDGNNDIYVMDIEKKTNRRLTHHPSTDFQPAWSPNGKWVAFTSDRDGDTDIYRMDVNGKNMKKLTSQGECNRPTWSPDSQSLAFISSSDGRYFIYVMGANGRGLKRLVGNMRIFGCAWSPDGKQIAFVSQDAEGIMGIFSIGVSGKNLRQLTQLDQRAFIFNRLAWSPSGEWIAYVLSERIGPLKAIRLDADLDVDVKDRVVCVVNPTAGGGKPIEATRGLVSSASIDWVPEGFLSVSPSAGKQTTLWGKLKQTEK